MSKLALATEQGVVICEGKAGTWTETRRELKDQHITAVISQEGIVLAGAEDGIFRSGDAGMTWQEISSGLSTRHVRWMAAHPDHPNLLLAGTEPANIFISRDGGESWRDCPEVAALRDRFKWSLPYSPEAGCVRGFAFHGSRLYAAVEVGGVLVSSDQGESWQLAGGSDGNPSLEGPPEPFIYPDVHSLEVHPSSPELVYAPTGGGFYRSSDGGKSWRLAYDCYCRAVWVDPHDPDHLLLGPADGVDRNGRIEESRDGGETWSMASNGLQVPWRRGMVERFFQAGDQLYAVLSNGQLLSTSISEIEWQRLLPNVGGINTMTVLI
jgi:photosystem II stability/assembly factor-like uncharacterized protein